LKKNPGVIFLGIFYIARGFDLLNLKQIIANKRKSILYIKYYS